ncbi:hypothetical protein GAPWKB11_1004 [Gilliamella apicola]|nr:hypothetical protein GAPWKB11_1004 [Gilliamella apicola]
MQGPYGSLTNDDFIRNQSLNTKILLTEMKIIFNITPTLTFQR